MFYRRLNDNSETSETEISAIKKLAGIGHPLNICINSNFSTAINILKHQSKAEIGLIDFIDDNIHLLQMIKSRTQNLINKDNSTITFPVKYYKCSIIGYLQQLQNMSYDIIIINDYVDEATVPSIIEIACKILTYRGKMVITYNDSDIFNYINLYCERQTNFALKLKNNNKNNKCVITKIGSKCN